MNIKLYVLFIFILTALPCISIAEQSERCAALNKASSERCAALNKASSERCAALNKASSERCAALSKASSQSTASQKANAKACAASQKANAEACAASQKANAEACAASEKANAKACAASEKANATQSTVSQKVYAANSSALSLDIPWWPDLPINFLKGIGDYFTGDSFQYTEYIYLSNETAENATPALKDLVNRATKNTPLHYGAAMDKAWETCVKNHPNADLETLLDCVKPY